jgi:hypothetical protein
MIYTNLDAKPTIIEIISIIYSDPTTTSPLIIEPHMLNFPGGIDRTPRELDLRLTNVSNGDVDLRLIDWPEGLLRVDLPRQIRKGATRAASVILEESAESLTFVKSFTIGVNEETRFTIPVIKISPRMTNQYPVEITSIECGDELEN